MSPASAIGAASSGIPVMPERCDFTVFGGTGDLALRKLLPALYQSDAEGHLPADTRIIGVSRSELDDDAYRAVVHDALVEHVGDVDDDIAERLLGRLSHVRLDVEEPDDWHALHGLLKDRPEVEATVRVYYLAVAPSLFGPICSRLDEGGMTAAPARVVLE